MKTLLTILLCLLIVWSFVACEKVNLQPENETTQSVTEEPSAEESISPHFISKQERMLWKDKIIDVLAAKNFYEDIEYGCLGVGLMDLTFDNTPEVIVAFSGGTMGNVCVGAYDLETGEELCVLGDTPHYQDWNNIYLCVHRNDEGKCVIVSEGALRDGLEWWFITSTLTEQFKLDVLFEEVTPAEGDKRYYIDGTLVDGTEFEKEKNQFKNDYKEITETQIQIVYWDSIDASGKSEAISLMADALVNSAQQFMLFDVEQSITQGTGEQELVDYQKAYLEFLKDKKGSHRLFALVFIDGDDIPELYLSGACEAEGDMICSFKNGKVVYQYLRRTGGGKYIEKSGNVINQNGHMGRYYTNAYKLNENGFSEVFRAAYTESYEHIGNEEYHTYREYFIDDALVSESDYTNAVNAAFDFSKAVRLDEYAVSYDEILQQLQTDSSGK